MNQPYQHKYQNEPLSISVKGIAATRDTFNACNNYYSYNSHNHRSDWGEFIYIHSYFLN